MLSRACAVALVAAGIACGLAFAVEPPASRPFDASLRGTVTVTFHGSRAAGCAQRGVCGMRGTERYVIRPGPSDGAPFRLLALRNRISGIGLVAVAGATTATVENGGAVICTRSIKPRFEVLSLQDARAGLVLGIAGATVPGGSQSATGVVVLGSDDAPDGVEPGHPFDLRCAGPRTTDLSAALPRAVVRRRAFLGTARVSMTGTRSFSGGGFAGTVRSDIHVTLSRGACEIAQRTSCTQLDHALGGGPA